MFSKIREFGFTPHSNKDSECIKLEFSKLEKNSRKLDMYWTQKRDFFEKGTFKTHHVWNSVTKLMLMCGRLGHEIWMKSLGEKEWAFLFFLYLCTTYSFIIELKSCSDKSKHISRFWKWITFLVIRWKKICHI